MIDIGLCLFGGVQLGELTTRNLFEMVRNGGTVLVYEIIDVPYSSRIRNLIFTILVI